MILNGNQRGNATDLAQHLMKAENERVEIHELRGFMSQDLMGAFNEIYAISRATRCTQFMYSLSLNPPKDSSISILEFERAIEQAEERLGLQGQARAIVFHEKHGRRHAHVVWSRIDLGTMKAVQMSYDREKLTALSQELFREYGWEMPRGLQKRGERDLLNYSHAQHQQAQRVGKNAGQIKAEIKAAWTNSDSRTAFEAALAECGYVLAKGDRRDFVLVDRDGEIYSLPRMAGVKTKEIHARLGDGTDLPSIEQVTAQWAQEQLAPEPDLTPKNALEKITRHHAAFTRAMMERTLKPYIKANTTRHLLIDELLQSDSVIHIGESDGKAVYSTPQMMALEQKMKDTAQEMICTASHKMNTHEVDRAIFNLNTQLAQETNGKASLSAEQIHAIHHMASDKQLSLVVGVAGAGKTTIMAGAKEALQAQGYRVRGAAPSGVAAANLKSIGINASTLHSLEYRIRMAQDMMDENTGKPLTRGQHDFIQSAMLTSKDVLIVDEAGMVSAAQLARIFELTKQSGAKLVLVGDPAQLQSIEAGAAFRTLLERNKSAPLTEVRRQQQKWQRTATQDLSRGDVVQALHAYDKHKCIHHSKTRSDAKAQLVTDMLHAQDSVPEQSRLVLAYTRQDVNDLNALIKAEMVKRGKVSEDNTDIIVTIKDGDIEREETQSFAIGDRIVFRENNRDLGVMNGTFGTLQSIERGQFHVTLDNGKDVCFCPQEYTRFQLGYAGTVHQSQGMTVDQAFVLATPHFDRHTTYVAMSRHKQSVKLYVSKSDFKTTSVLHRSLGKEGNKLSTLDFTDPQGKQPTLEEPTVKSSWKTRFKSGAKSVWQQLRGKNLDSKSMTEPDRLQNAAGIEKPQPSSMAERDKSLPTHHAKPLQQQEFSALRDQFMRNANSAKVRQDKEQQQSLPTRNMEPER